MGQLRSRRIAAKKGSEEYYETVVEAEYMIARAFGSIDGPLKTFFNISKFNVENYLSALLGRCALCQNKMNRRSSSLDDNYGCIVPQYTFSHPMCNRKHLVCISNGAQPVQRGAEPRELHKELSAVVQMNPRNTRINRDSVFARLSPQYKINYEQKMDSAPMMVWLRPHPLVEFEDTLYGAVGITNQEVKESVRALDAHNDRLSRQAAAKRQRLAKRMDHISRQFFADIRVWLGKGHTRWRSIEDVTAFHPQMMSSMGLIEHYCEALHPGMKRINPNNTYPYPVCNVFMLMERTLSHVKDSSGGIVDWLISSIKIDSAFDSFELQFADPKNVDWMVEEEANTVAAVLNSLSVSKPEDVTIESFSKTTYSTKECAAYSVKMSMYLSGLENHRLVAWSRFIISHEDICKLKVVASKLMDPALAMSLPTIPTSEDAASVGDFFSIVIKACFAKGAAYARSKALSVIISQQTFQEIKSRIGYSESEMWVGEGDVGEAVHDQMLLAE